MKAVLIDAYDSFVYIIDQYLREIGVETEVIRNDQADIARLDAEMADFLVLGPGPGHPKDAGYLELINRYEGELPILGVCLGHQAISLRYGGQIRQAKQLLHGKTSRIDHDGRGCFTGILPGLSVTRYHSLVVSEEALPAPLKISAIAMDDGEIMGIRHAHLPIEGIQFHPESITTQHGMKLLTNFIDMYVG